MKKYWCKHIAYVEEYIDGVKRRFWLISDGAIARPSWKYCPVCKTKRPKLK